jgi:hypothetical protein
MRLEATVTGTLGDLVGRLTRGPCCHLTTPFGCESAGNQYP